MDLNLKGHLAVVTGGASGIGWGIARGFATEGCHVALWDRSANVLEQARQLGVDFGVKTLGIIVDVASEASVTEAQQQTVQSLGVPEHIVHAAAIGSGKFGFPFSKLQPADWLRVIDVNVMGMVHVAHATVPGMLNDRRGTLVFVSSVAGQIGSQTDPPYSASKAANINFAQCLAKDLAPHGIRVNTVCPGMVQTPLNKGVWESWNNDQPADKKRSYEEWAGDKVKAIVPLGRWQTPENIADMIVFLSSSRASEVTGQTINVDGGYVMHW